MNVLRGEGGYRLKAERMYFARMGCSIFLFGINKKSEHKIV